MKLFCNCNSKWPEKFFDDLLSNRRAALCLDTFQDESIRTSIECQVCFLDVWVSPEYENMMHDLKSMNQ